MHVYKNGLITSDLRLAFTFSECVCSRQSKHTHVQGFMLSPNVISAVKRLTSGHLFKSGHQTHSFFFLSSQITRHHPISSASSAVGQTRPTLFSRRLSFIIYRGSVPRRRHPPPNTRQPIDRQTMDSKELEVAVDSLWRMMSATSDPDSARHQPRGQRVKRGGGR